MSPDAALSVEVADQLRGVPARGLRCRVVRIDPPRPLLMVEAVTGADGTVRLDGRAAASPCRYRITLETGTPLESVSVTVTPPLPYGRCHVLILLAPHGVQVAVSCGRSS
ncbi:hypothetical protein [Streptomyces niveiscabiei]|uniref:Uncharacterized protein n=1 Tax=Streptomyces niveiscabiei TaxID=164115 RepID=A0ABW9HHL7_9ACTN